jgi:putative transposase
MRTLAHEGPAAYRDRYELIHRHRAERPNAVWQCDHTELDVLVVGERGKALRPWLTVVLDDHSRAVAGYSLLTDAPSALNTALALRQAIWRKGDPGWPVCGIPDVLYVDHGTDFTSTHVAQVAADLRMRLVHSAVARPQGRGKIERFFGTVNSELLADMPGHLASGGPVTPPRLTLSELDAAIRGFVTGRYNARTHPAIGMSPNEAWTADGWLPRMPERLEDLDELLAMVARPRVVRRDGIRFGGLRYLDPTLAAFVGERVTIRHDPRDVAEIRVFHRGRFLCRAINAEHADRTVSLRDVQAARRARREALRAGIKQRIAAVPAQPVAASEAVPQAPKRPRPRLKVYREDD